MVKITSPRLESIPEPPVSVLVFRVTVPAPVLIPPPATVLLVTITLPAPVLILRTELSVTVTAPVCVEINAIAVLPDNVTVPESDLIPVLTICELLILTAPAESIPLPSRPIFPFKVLSLMVISVVELVDKMAPPSKESLPPPKSVVSLRLNCVTSERTSKILATPVLPRMRFPLPSIVTESVTLS